MSQPFAFLIARGPKRIENRTWTTSYRGTLLIHAGKGRQYLDDYEDMRREWWPELGIPPWAEVPRGAVVASCRLAACVTLTAARVRRNLDPGEVDWAEGPWCWLLRDVRPLADPVPWAGSLGLWDAPPALERLVMEQLRRAETLR